MTLAIIVVLFKSEEAIPALWSSLRDQSGPWHLYAIDNASPDSSATYLEAQHDPRITLIRAPTNEGFARAVNRGLRLATTHAASRHLLLNPDVELPPNFLADLTAAWDNHAAQIIAPRIMQRDAPHLAWYAGGGLDRGWAFGNRHDPYDPADPPARTVDFASGCCLGITPETLEQIGLLDESFFVYWEDTDFCLRLEQAGIPIQYVAHPTLLHEGGASSGGERAPAATRLYYRSYIQLLRKHFGLPVALRTIGRLLAKQAASPHPARTTAMALAMARGLLAPLRAVPALAALASRPPLPKPAPTPQRSKQSPADATAAPPYDPPRPSPRSAASYKHAAQSSG